MLAAKFSETCILKYFETMTNFPNTVKHQAHGCFAWFIAGKIQPSWSQVAKYNARCSGVNRVVEVFNAAPICDFQKEPG